MQIIRNQCCPICGGSAEPIIYLPNYPVTEIYQEYGKNDFKFPTSFHQTLNFCEVCQHGFLGSLLPKEFIYGNYNTETSSSEGSIISINNFYKFIVEHNRNKPDLIIDIGANDSSLLEKFKSTFSRLVGIDPNIKSSSGDIECIRDYVENVDIAQFSANNRIFISSHTLEHIYNPAELLETLSKVATNNDEFYFQFPSLDLLVRDCRFDQVHHQHIQYFTLNSFSLLLNRFGFEIIEYNFDSDHYGVLMCFFKRRRNSGISPAKDFGGAIVPSAILLSHSIFTSAIESANHRLSNIGNQGFYCYGASLMLPIISYYMPNLIKAISIFDGDPSKIGKSYVNFDVCICSEGSLELSNEDVVITALSTKMVTRRIASKLFSLGARNIIIPFNSL